MNPTRTPNPAAVPGRPAAPRPRAGAVRAAALAAALLAGAAASAGAADATAPRGAAGAAVAPESGRPVVAEATLVIGMARLNGGEGAPRLVEKGMPVRVGDRIETDVGGHVHLRFVDGARVSVRPSSRLAVEDYSRPGAAGGAIRFRLEEGVVRSITGQWGDAARDSFRLNTPLAAIGIKGTDFVARAEPQRTSASVFTGAIVVTPLDADCARTVGPCVNGLEALLTQEQRGQALQVASAQARPVHMAAAEAPLRGSRPTLTAVAARASGISDDDAFAPGSGVGEGGKSIANARLAAEGIVTAAAAPPRVEQLAWGRWSWAAPIDGDTLSREIDAAFRQGREGLVSNGAFSLYRPAVAPLVDQRLLQREPSVSFRLAGGSAYIVRSSLFEPDPATVQGGRLDVDFARNTFSTQLRVSGPTIGTQVLDAAGSVLANGVFLSTGGNTWVAGGLSLDGREAGYLFERNLPNGQLRGITLWGP